MAERITANELNRRSGEILKRVQEGEAFHITKHGKAIAILTRVEEDPDMGKAKPGNHGLDAQLDESNAELERILPSSETDPAATEPPTSNTHTVRTMATSTAQQATKPPWKSYGGLSKQQQAGGKYDR